MRSPRKSKEGPGASQDLRGLSGSPRIHQVEGRFVDHRVQWALSRACRRSFTRPLSPPRALSAGRAARRVDCETWNKTCQEETREETLQELTTPGTLNADSSITG